MFFELGKSGSLFDEPDFLKNFWMTDKIIPVIIKQYDADQISLKEQKSSWYYHKKTENLVLIYINMIQVIKK